ncbi:hypothetical protein F2R67_12050 [Alistipes onderdonkii]|nr:hypothetical protein F2R67_12050 [Alistipes onderdonkii]
MTNERLCIFLVFSNLIAVAIWGTLAASLFGSCNVYEYEEVEIIHCPQIQDTIQIPDWEPEE